MGKTTGSSSACTSNFWRLSSRFVINLQASREAAISSPALPRLLRELNAERGGFTAIGNIYIGILNERSSGSQKISDLRLLKLIGAICRIQAWWKANILEDNLLSRHGHFVPALLADSRGTGDHATSRA
jgi:hypothetical protein